MAYRLYKVLKNEKSFVKKFKLAKLKVNNQQEAHGAHVTAPVSLGQCCHSCKLRTQQGEDVNNTAEKFLSSSSN